MCAKKNIKNLILETSRDLFNEHSWSDTSLRKIASSLSISDGNLRYHFKTKEDIVVGLFKQMSEEMLVVIDDKSEDLLDSTHDFERIFRVMYRYRFLFLESYFIKKAYCSYAELFSQLEMSRRQLFEAEFNKLKDRGVLSSAFSPVQYEMLFEQIFIISDSWLKYILNDAPSHVNERIAHYARLCTSLLLPYMNLK